MGYMVGLGGLRNGHGLNVFSLNVCLCTPPLHCKTTMIFQRRVTNSMTECTYRTNSHAQVEAPNPSCNDHSIHYANGYRYAGAIAQLFARAQRICCRARTRLPRNHCTPRDRPQTVRSEGAGDERTWRTFRSPRPKFRALG